MMITETEYIKITNQVKITAALGILREVIGGYGISEEDIMDIRCKLSNVKDGLFGSYDVQEDEFPNPPCAITECTIHGKCGCETCHIPCYEPGKDE
jgi:hypothetical protein